MTNLTVSEVMKSDVLAVDTDWPIEKLTRFLVEHNISGAPVVDKAGELVGVVSLTDIARQGGMVETDREGSDPHEYYLYSLERQLGREELAMFHVQQESEAKARDIMTPMVYSVAEETPVQEVADTMIKGRIHRVFVTDDTQLTGIVTALDMLQIVRDL